MSTSDKTLFARSGYIVKTLQQVCTITEQRKRKVLPISRAYIPSAPGGSRTHNTHLIRVLLLPLGYGRAQQHYTTTKIPREAALLALTQ